ncbi:MAG: hypothetical protein QOH56_4347 [Pseudonocardiales bacterium]|jgi:hypothetical protein|nr:hypothetical protein [Pseudonocardiales bacterium]
MSNLQDNCVHGGTAADFTAVNPVIPPFELAVESDTGRMKVGDGVTAWTALDYIAGVKTGTAVLVAGSVVVADTRITANSVIRVASRVLGGTPGALFISAKAAGTSFTIGSTSNTETSTVRYDVIAY